MRRRLRSGPLLGLIAAFFFLGAAPSYATPQLLGQWHFDAPGSQGSISSPDSSGNGHELLTGDGAGFTLFNPGRFGPYLSETSNNQGEAGAISPAHVTLLAWVRGFTPTKDEVIAGQASDNRTCDRMAYRLRYEDGDTFSGLEFSVLVGGQVIASPPVGSNALDGQWHLVAGTYDGSKVRLYVDGTEVGSGTATPGGPIGYGSSPGGFGVDGFTGDGNCVTRDFAGGIDELRVYDEALTGPELADLANPAHTTPPTLVPDTDNDGVPDPSDNCVTTPNPDQADGDHNGVGDACQDSDGDGVVDVHDNCPDVSNPNQTEDFFHPGIGVACDQDQDGVRDANDNCPNIGNEDQRDDNHDGIGHACQLPTPRLDISPNPTCTGILTTLNAGASDGGDDPIQSYQLSYSEPAVDDSSGNAFTYVNFTRVVDLGTSSTPNFVAIFTWNVQSLYNPFNGLAGKPSYYDPARRDPADVGVRITNTAGQTAGGSFRVNFAQTDSTKSRFFCPGSVGANLFSAPTVQSISTNALGSTVSFKSACRNSIDCLGSALLFKGSLIGAGAAKAKAKPKKPQPVVVGLRVFRIPKGKTGTVKVKLTKNGLKLLKKHHKLAVTLSVTTVSPTGKNVTRTKSLTLKPKKKKH
jgi:hypothetical protein